MRNMTEAEYMRFMAQGTRTAKAATVRADGRPHITPVWFLLDGDALVFTTHETSVKALDLRRDPHISLCMDDEAPPFAYVIIEGTVALSEDSDELLRWATRIGGKYMGADRAEEYGKRNGVPGELIVRVTPTKILARADIAS
jgi:PPOX class probable F420-dependent enzyme